MERSRKLLDIVSNKSVMLSFMEKTLTRKNSGFSYFSRYFPHAIETKEEATFEKIATCSSWFKISEKVLFLRSVSTLKNQ